MNRMLSSPDDDFTWMEIRLKCEFYQAKVLGLKYVTGDAT